MSQKKAKRLRQQMRKDGVTPTKTIFMSRDTKVKFDLRNRVIEQWQLIRNIMETALKSELKDETLKGSIKTVEGLAATILMGVNQDLDYWFDQELERQGFGKESGYIPVGINPENGAVTLAKSPRPPMPDEKVMAVIEDADKRGCSVEGCKNPIAFIDKDHKGFCKEHSPVKEGGEQNEVPKEDSQSKAE